MPEDGCVGLGVKTRQKGKEHNASMPGIRVAARLARLASMLTWAGPGSAEAPCRVDGGQMESKLRVVLRLTPIPFDIE